MSNLEPIKADPFVEELSALINKHSKENGSDTADFVLAEYMNMCLENFNYCVRYRDSLKD